MRLGWVGFLGLGLLVGIGNAQARPRLQLAITFDDLPQHGDAPPGVSRTAILQGIERALLAAHVPPTYGFVNANTVAGDRDLEGALQSWREAGQLLGNHTFRHPDINNVSAQQFEQDILLDEPLLQKFGVGMDWHWFRYPFLHEGDTAAKRSEVRNFLKAHGYRIAEVNNDFSDYLWADPYARCAAKGNSSAIKTLHDTYLAAAAQDVRVFRALARREYKHDIPYVLLMHVGAFDAKMLPELLAQYKREGFTFVSLEQAEKDPAYAEDPDMGDAGGGTLMEQMANRKQLDIPANGKPEKMLERICGGIAARK